MRRGLRSRRIVGVLLALAPFASGCKKAGEPAPQVSALVYEVQVSVGKSVVTSQMTITLNRSGDEISASVDTEGQQALFKLNSQLYQDQGKMEVRLKGLGQPFALGMLWLPTADRKEGMHTKAGVLAKQRKYYEFDVFEALSSSMGSRFYDVQTGLLDGFMDHGGQDVTGRLKERR